MGSTLPVAVVNVIFREVILIRHMRVPETPRQPHLDKTQLWNDTSILNGGSNQRLLFELFFKHK